MPKIIRRYTSVSSTDSVGISITSDDGHNNETSNLSSDISSPSHSTSSNNDNGKDYVFRIIPNINFKNGAASKREQFASKFVEEFRLIRKLTIDDGLTQNSPKQWFHNIFVVFFNSKNKFFIF